MASQSSNFKTAIPKNEPTLHWSKCMNLALLARIYGGSQPSLLDQLELHYGETWLPILRAIETADSNLKIFVRQYGTFSCFQPNNLSA